MTESIQNPQTRALFTLALEDEFVLTLALPENIFGFHAQQSGEKFLKTLLSARNAPYRFTHQLNNLQELLEHHGEVLPATPWDLATLQPYAGMFRYEQGASLAEADKASIRASGAVVRRFVLDRIMQLEQAG